MVSPGTSRGTHKKVTTSLELAKATGKLHRHVLQTIRNIEPDWIELGNNPFTQSEYTSVLGAKKPCYELSKEECLYIASRFTKLARTCVMNYLAKVCGPEENQDNSSSTPRDGYPTVSGFFQLVSVADLHYAMSMLIAFTKKEVYNSKSEQSRELRHSANVLSTFAKTLAANSESLESHFAPLICK